MEIAAGLFGLVLIVGVLSDSFQTIVLPRRVTRNGLARLFYRAAWRLWSAAIRPMRDTGRREAVLGVFGPLSLLMLLGIWATLLITGFAALQWALGSQVADGALAGRPGARPDFFSDLYMSGVTFFTLGFGDVVPLTLWPRIVGVVEAGVGFAFLGLVIGYLPPLTQAFSHREVNVSLLDERAGSPPSACELLSRYGPVRDDAATHEFLRDWEVWSAELLEGHISYPVLCYFRSQHERQSWVAALTMVLDACALVIAGVEGENVAKRDARQTFGMARHAAVDLSQVLGIPLRPPDPDRLPPAALMELSARLTAASVPLRAGDPAEVASTLAELRALYEPYVNALSLHLLMPLPPWLPEQGARDAWEISVWERQHGRKGLS
jgi:hypothetical protein